MGDRADRYCFAMPPSLGDDSVRFLARQFADVLFDAGFATVVPMKSYSELVDALVSGEADAAWGPPVVCGLVERAGGRVALCSERAGTTTYRSVIITRTNSGYDSLDKLRDADVPVRAVWVDPWSVGGYLLARHHIESEGYDPNEMFASQEFLGSYEACVKALLGYDADVSASFAGPRGLGHVEHAEERARELMVAAETAECPADAIVLSPRLDAEAANELTAALLALIADARAMEILRMALDVDGLVTVPAGRYAALPFLDQVGTEP